MIGFFFSKLGKKSTKFQWELENTQKIPADPDQDRKTDTQMVFMKDILERSLIRKKSIDDKKACKITLHANS